ncbi:unnamed protein product [Boreogadus saida]
MSVLMYLANCSTGRERRTLVDLVLTKSCPEEGSLPQTVQPLAGAWPDHLSEVEYRVRMPGQGPLLHQERLSPYGCPAIALPGGPKRPVHQSRHPEHLRDYMLGNGRGCWGQLSLQVGAFLNVPGCQGLM